MRLLLLAAALLPFVSAEASATAWYRVGGNAKTVTYVDLDSIRPIGGKTIVLTQSVYANALDGTAYYASAIRSEYDCRAGAFRMLEFTYYGQTGNFILTEPSESINDLNYPAKGSINEAVLDFVCYRKGGTAVTNPFTDAKAQFPILGEP